jgi:hypothetical protein
MRFPKRLEESHPVSIIIGIGFLDFEDAVGDKSQSLCIGNALPVFSFPLERVKKAMGAVRQLHERLPFGTHAPLCPGVFRITVYIDDLIVSHLNQQGTPDLTKLAAAHHLPINAAWQGGTRDRFPPLR